MSVKVSIVLNDTTELPEPQVDAWIDGNGDVEFDPTEMFTLTRSGGTWKGTKANASGGYLMVRVRAPLGTLVKISATGEKETKIERKVVTRPDWFLGEVK